MRVLTPLSLRACMAALLMSWQPCDALPAAWDDSAYLRQEVRHSFEGQAHGLGYKTARGLFEQCNAFRASAALAPQWPPEELLAGIDVEVVEHLYDRGRALTWREGYTVEPTDLRRWLDESRRAPGAAVAPPDCSRYRKVPLRSGVLWVDGVRYQLTADKRAIGSRRHPSLSARPAAITLPDPLPEPELIAGQPCQRVAGGNGIARGSSCVWTRFPLQAYLNWPWMLSAHSVVGMGPTPLVEDVRTVEVQAGRRIPAERFRIPADYLLKMLP